jgi:hypothetical protein
MTVSSAPRPAPSQAPGLRLIALAALAAVLILPVSGTPARSQADPVVAKVDGVEIRQSDLDLAEEDLGQNAQQMTGDQKREYLVGYVADIMLSAKAAEGKRVMMPPIDGVRFATAEAGIKYKGRTDVCSRCSTRARRSPASSPARSARRRRSTGAARPEGRQGAGARGQLRQRQRLHRQEGPRDRSSARRGRAQALGCKPTRSSSPPPA